MLVFETKSTTVRRYAAVSHTLLYECMHTTPRKGLYHLPLSNHGTVMPPLLHVAAAVTCSLRPYISPATETIW